MTNGVQLCIDCSVYWPIQVWCWDYIDSNRTHTTNVTGFIFVKHIIGLFKMFWRNNVFNQCFIEIIGSVKYNIHNLALKQFASLRTCQSKLEWYMVLTETVFVRVAPHNSYIQQTRYFLNFYAFVNKKHVLSYRQKITIYTEHISWDHVSKGSTVHGIVPYMSFFLS